MSDTPNLLFRTCIPNLLIECIGIPGAGKCADSPGSSRTGGGDRLEGPRLMPTALRAKARTTMPWMGEHRWSLPPCPAHASGQPSPCMSPMGCGPRTTAPVPRGEPVSGQCALPTAASTCTRVHRHHCPRAPPGPHEGWSPVAPEPCWRPPFLPWSACCPHCAHTACPLCSHTFHWACCPFRRRSGARCCFSWSQGLSGPQWGCV